MDTEESDTSLPYRTLDTLDRGFPGLGCLPRGSLGKRSRWDMFTAQRSLGFIVLDTMLGLSGANPGHQAAAWMLAPTAAHSRPVC